MTDQRADDVEKIEQAYLKVETALKEVGYLLRTTEAGKYMWSSDHKAALTGLRVLVAQLRRDVPAYGREG